MDFREYLKITAKEIDQALDKFLEEWEREVRNLSPALIPLTSLFIENCQGGKRLRGALVKLGYELVNKKGNSAILKPALAIEIFQTAILAHDDIIDQSLLRRGKPTLYRQLGGNHYGISQTISLADIGFFLALRLIVNSDFPDKNKVQAIKTFSRALINTGLGEVLDIKLSNQETEKVNKDVITLHKLKTSYYTIIDPLHLGVKLAGGDQDLLKRIEKFGENLGIAFQIQDDILGVFGDEKELGKSVTSDIVEGKNTLFIIYALKHSSPAQKKVLKKYYGNGKINKFKLEEVRQIFINTGALAYSKTKSLAYVADAKKVIPKITKNEKYVKLLSSLADFLVERTK